MAEVIDNFDWEHRRREDSPYDWDNWLDGRTWKLKEGEDFAIKRESFTSNAYGEARCRGGKARISLVQGDGIVMVQFYKP